MPKQSPDGPPDTDHGEVQYLPEGVLTVDGLAVEERVLDPQRFITTGSNFLCGNGYLGYRGTFPEWTADEYAGCVVSDTYDRADGRWTELCTVPDGLWLRWSLDGEALVKEPSDLSDVLSYRRSLSLRDGVHTRRWARRLGRDAAEMRDARFTSLSDRHLVPLQTTVTLPRAGPLTLEAGIDGGIWSLHGDHFATCVPSSDRDALQMLITTVEQHVDIAVVQTLRVRTGRVAREEVSPRTGGSCAASPSTPNAGNPSRWTSSWRSRRATTSPTRRRALRHPRHGSSLSPSAHAVLAARIGRPEEAYRYCMRSLGLDLFAKESKTSGGTFIGGIRTAACGAAWQILTRGFAGLDVRAGGIFLDPVLPHHWRRVRFNVCHRGQRVAVEVMPDGAQVAADAANDRPVPVTLGKRCVELAAGEHVRFPR
jgi:trehalose/maltose hydrolase-like predicted phosphorylase